VTAASTARAGRPNHRQTESVIRIGQEGELPDVLKRFFVRKISLLSAVDHARRRDTGVTCRVSVWIEILRAIARSPQRIQLLLHFEAGEGRLPAGEKPESVLHYWPTQGGAEVADIMNIQRGSSRASHRVHGIGCPAQPTGGVRPKD